MEKRYGNGMIIGKFMPLHLGHEYLIRTGLEMCDHLTVLVSVLPGEPINGLLRFHWVKERFPKANVVYLEDFIPIYPRSDLRYWEMWTDHIRRHLDKKPDVVLSSEDYGDGLAKWLGAEHVCVDKAREEVGISGTQIRADPIGCIDYISPAARSYFVGEEKHRSKVRG